MSLKAHSQKRVGFIFMLNRTLKLNIEAELQAALKLHKKGNIAAAFNKYRAILKIDPRNADAANLIGLIKVGEKKSDEAIEFFMQAVKIQPKNQKFQINLGVAYLNENRLDESLKTLKLAVNIDESNYEAIANYALTFLKLAKYDDAIYYFNRALSIKNTDQAIYCNLGVCYASKEDFENALEFYNKAIEINPNYAYSFYNIGNLFSQINELNSAIKAYKTCIDLDNQNSDAYCNLGNAYEKNKEKEKALNCYLKAIELNPNFSEAYCNVGNIYSESDKNKAVEFYSKSIAINDKLTQPYVNRAFVYFGIKNYLSAIKDYEKAIALGRSEDFLQSSLIHFKQNICDWSEESRKEINLIYPSIANGKRVANPFDLLSVTDDSSIHEKASKIFSEKKYFRNKKIDQTKIRIEKTEKIVVAYFSSDFYEHATSYLFAELVELHNKNDFYIIGFSYSGKHNDSITKRFNDSFDEFINVTDLSDFDIAKLSREKKVAIAVDLKGHTFGSRLGIFNFQAAPIQLSYLGYPGTIGLPTIDYIIADKIVIPPSSNIHYTEKIVYLPNSYQINDSRKKISERIFTKSELSLPETGFIFCCFNNNYKITPTTFDGWIRILNAVEGSVLWLFEDNPTAAENLQKEAEKRGLKKNRLVFATRMPLDEHLARHRLADLFIDTFPYNAHTTASDALWAGLPLLTLMGESFASRVASSLLNAIGLPELTTRTQEEYEAKAIELANTPELLKQIKQKLASNRLSTPLFNTKQFARNIEAAYSAMYARYQEALLTDHLYIEDIDIPQKIELKAENAKSLTSVSKPVMKLFGILELDELIQVMDVGASAINETPFYTTLLESGLAHLNAFEGDPRQIEEIRSTYGNKCTVFNEFLFDGSEQTLYVASGMSSLFKPKQAALNFFNGFNQFGKIERTERIRTKRLDDVNEITNIDVLKMDIQGAELTVLQNASEKLRNCLVIQLEVSYIQLYENQPSFGDIDVWMRKQGYAPHCFLDIKRWSIAPTIFNNNFRVPGNQLLESDIVYVKDPLNLGTLTVQQIIKFAAVAHYALKSFDLCIFLLLELARRKVVPANIQKIYLSSLKTKYTSY